MKTRFLLALSAAFSIGGAAVAMANPAGEVVQAGSATFIRGGPGSLSVNQATDKVIIDWRTFSIGAGEVTRFIQPNASSAALNRVLGGNPSQIYGMLQANGQVYVINPAGILVGPSGVINTRGFVGSTLDINNASFLSGVGMRFEGSSSASVRNEGTISALGGDVFLFAHTVENAGSIDAASGTVGLAAGREILLRQSGNERISVLAGNISAPPTATGVNNAGAVQAASAELQAAGGNMYALAINNGGIVRANTIVNQGGRILLKASGGNIQNSGTLNASGVTGGSVTVDGGHNAAAPATVVSSGTIDASGSTGAGGTAKVLGDHVGLFGSALVDVSGAAGGGTALIGGDFQGKNPNVQNASAAFVGSGARITANANSIGNGGKVIVWADDSTRFYGTIDAQGGQLGGNGGFVETSGKSYLEMIGGAVNAAAAMGSPGTWLLDPRDVFLRNVTTAGGTFGGGNPVVFTPSANDAIVNITDIQNSLNNGTSVTITTGATGGQSGDITVEAAIAKTADIADATLTLSAARNLTFNSGATIASTSGRLSLSLTADSDANGSGDFSMAAADSFTTRGGEITINGVGISLGALNTSIPFINSGNVLVNATGTLAVNGDITTTGGVALNNGNGRAGGDVQLTGPTVVVNATINTSGSQGDSGGGGNTGGTGGAIKINPSPAIRGSVNTSTGTLTANGGAANGGNNNGAAGGVIEIRGTSVTLGPVNAVGGAGSGTGNPGSGGTLALDATGGVNQTAGAISVAGLRLLGAGAFTLDQVGNDVATLAGNVDGAISYTDANALTIGTVTTVGLTAGNNPVTIRADTLNIAQALSSGTAKMTLKPLTGGREIDLGTEVGTKLSLEAAELNRVTASVIEIGSATAGGITISEDAVAPAGWNTLSLHTSGAISQQANDTITVANLVLRVGADTTLNEANSVTTLAATKTSVGNITFNYTDANGLAIGSVGGVDGIAGVSTFGLTMGGNLTQTQPVTTSGLATFTVTAAGTDVFLGLANSFNSVAFATSGGTFDEITLQNSGALVLGSITLGGNLSITAGGDITQTAATAITANGVGKTATFSAATFDVILGEANDFTKVLATGDDVTITDANAIDLGAMTVGGGLTVTAGGNITQSGGALGVTGNSSFTVNAGAATDLDILLGEANNLNGTVTFAEAGSANLRNLNLRNIKAGPVAFPTVTAPGNLNDLTLTYNNSAVVLPTLTLGGNLTVTAGGTITQSGALTVNGATAVASFTADANDITLTDAGNNFRVFRAVSGNNVSVRDVGTLELGSSTVTGDLTVTTAGDLTQTAGSAILANGTGKLTTFSVGANDITLNNTGNDFTRITTSTDDVTITDLNAINLGAMTLTGNLAVTAGGHISQSGVLTVDGAGKTASFTVTAADSDILLGLANKITAPTLTISGAGTIRDISFRNTLAGALTPGLPATVRNLMLQLDAAGVALPAIMITGDLAVTAGGNITQTGIITANGTGKTATFDAGANNVLLNTFNNDFTKISFTVANDARLTESTAVDLGTSTLTGDLDVTGGGHITQSGVLTVNGAGKTASFTVSAADSDILLGLANQFSAVTFGVSGPGSLRDVALRNTLATATLTGVGIPTTLRNLTLQFDTSAITLPAYTITEDLDVTAGGAITQTAGTSLQVTGDASFRSTGAAANGDILLSALNGLGIPINNFGTLKLDSPAGTAVVAYEGSAMRLDTVSVGLGSLSLASVGMIDQVASRTLTVPAANATTIFIGAPNSDVLLTEANTFGLINFFNYDGGSGLGTVRDLHLHNVLVSPTALLPSLPANLRNLTLQFDNAAIELPATTLTGNLSVTAGGNITQSGALGVSGVGQTATFAAGANNITINDAANDFNTVLITSGADVSITDANSINLGATTVTGTYLVNAAAAGGAITGSGVIEAAKLGLTANAGIGASGSPLLTEVGMIEAVTETGGIFIDNTGAVSIGGVSAGLTGVRVITSGNIVLNNSGSVSILNGGEIVKSPGDVTVNANGLAADLVTGGNNNGNSGNGALNSGGHLIANAGRNILLGGGGTGFGDIRGNKTTLTAGTDVTVTSSSFVDAVGVPDGLGNGGELTITAGQNITLTGGRFTTAGGTLWLNGVAVTLNNQVSAGTGVITLNNSGGAVGTGNLSGATLNLIGVGSVGTLGGRLNTAVDMVIFAKSAGNTFLNEADALTLQGTSSGANIDVTAAGGITLSAALSAGAGSVTLNGTTIGLGGFNLTGGAVSVTHSGALTTGAGAINATTLTLNGGGTVGVNVATRANTAAGSIVFNKTGGNSFISEANAVALQGTTGGGNLDLAGGALSLSAALSTGPGTVTLNGPTIGLAGFNLTGGAVNFTHSGALTTGAGVINASTLTLNGGGTVGVDAATRANTAAGAIVFNKSGGNSFINETDAVSLQGVTSGADLAVLAGGTISLGAALNAGAGTITLNAPAISLGGFNLTGAAVDFTHSGALTTGAGVINATLLTLNGGGGVNANTAAGTIVFNKTGGNSFINESDAVSLQGVSGNGSLEVLAGGAIALTATLNTGTGDAALSGATIGLAGFDLTGANVTLNHSALASSGAGSVNATTLTLNGGGNFGTLGARFNTAVGTVIFTKSGGNSFLNESDAMNLQGTTGNGSVDLLAVGGLALTGALNAGIGDVALSGTTIGLAGFDLTGANVTLNHSALASSSAGRANATTLILNGSGDVGASGARFNTGAGSIVFNKASANTFLNELDAVNIEGSSALLDLVAGGAVGQAAALATPVLTVKTLSDAGAGITLNSFVNEATTVDFRARNALDSAIAAGAVSYSDATGVVIAGIQSAGDVIVTAVGAITQSGVVTANGALKTATFSAAGQAITLGDANNDFTTVKFTGADVTVRDQNALDLGTSTMTGDLNVTAVGAITQSGTVTANGAGKTATFSAAGQAITLGVANNDFTTAKFTGADVTVKDINALDLGASTITGNLNVTAAGTMMTPGGITQSGTMTANGAGKTATFNVSVDKDVLLGLANDFTSVSVPLARNITLKDINGFTLGQTAARNGTLNLQTTTGDITQILPVDHTTVGMVGPTVEAWNLTANVGGALVLGNPTPGESKFQPLNKIGNIGPVSHQGQLYVTDSDATAYGPGNPNPVPSTVSAMLGLTINGPITGTGETVIQTLEDLALVGAAGVTIVSTTGADSDIELAGKNFHNLLGASVQTILGVEKWVAAVPAGGPQLIKTDAGSRFLVFSTDRNLNFNQATDTGKLTFNGLGADFLADQVFFDNQPTPIIKKDGSPDNGIGNGFVFVVTQDFVQQNESDKFFIQVEKITSVESVDATAETQNLPPEQPPTVWTSSYHIYLQEREEKEKKKKGSTQAELLGPLWEAGIGGE